MFFSSALMIALVISISYSVLEEDPAINIENFTEKYFTDIDVLPNETLPGIFFLNFPLEDEAIINWTLPIPTSSEVEEALNEGKRALGDKEMLEEILVTPVLNSPSYRHQKAVSTSSEARSEGKIGFVEDRATIFLAKKFQHNMRKIGRSNIGKGANTKIKKKLALNCMKSLMYRFYNGTCNNLKHRLWGSAMIPFRR